MVLHFPSKLTDEEEALQLKYAKLRRKKKQLQEVNKPKQEPEQNKVGFSSLIIREIFTNFYKAEETGRGEGCQRSGQETPENWSYEGHQEISREGKISGRENHWNI